MSAAVKRLRYNWRAVGSTVDRDGAGDDCDYFEVGRDDVKSIVENIPNNGMEFWNFFVTKTDGSKFRVFNPNFIEYFKEG